MVNSAYFTTRVIFLSLIYTMKRSNMTSHIDDIRARIQAYKIVVNDITSVSGNVDHRISDQMNKYEMLVNAYENGTG